MKVGDLVTSRDAGHFAGVATIVEIKPGRFSSQTNIALVMLPSGELIEKITAKLETVNEDR